MGITNSHVIYRYYYHITIIIVIIFQFARRVYSVVSQSTGWTGSAIIIIITIKIICMWYIIITCHTILKRWISIASDDKIMNPSRYRIKFYEYHIIAKIFVRNFDPVSCAPFSFLFSFHIRLGYCDFDLLSLLSLVA